MKTRPGISQAIAALSPNGVWSVTEEDLDRIDWQSPDVKRPSKSAIQAKLTELLKDYDSKQYQRDRQYLSIGDQLDMIYWDKKNGTENWKETIDKVKSDHPKPK